MQPSNPSNTLRFLMRAVIPTACVALTLLTLAACRKAASWSDNSTHKSGFVTANGIRLHYLDWGGSGPMLILIHGYGANPHLFDDLAPAFTDRFRVVAYARRGHPQSDAKGPYDTATLTEDLRGLMDALGFSDLEWDELQLALDWFPDFPEALNNLGASRAQAGDTAEAKKLFRSALDIEPTYVSATRNLGTAFMQERNYSSAIEEYRHGLEINPRDAVLPNLLAKAYLGRSSTGDVEKAISVIREALERDPDNIGAHELLADIHTHFTNDLQQAAYHRAEALRAREAAYHLPPLPE